MNEKYLVTPKTSAEITQAAEDDKSESLQEIQSKRAISYLVPSWAGVLSYVLITLIVLLVFNVRILTQAIANTQPEVSSQFTEVVQQQLKFYGDQIVVSWLTIILFWGSVGLAVYTVFWLGMAFVTAARNEMVVETAFSNRGHFQDRIRVPLIKIILIGAILISFILVLRFGLPLGTSLFASGLYAIFQNIPLGIMYIALSLIGGAITCYILRTLVVYFRHAEGIF